MDLKTLRDTLLRRLLPDRRPQTRFLGHADIEILLTQVLEAMAAHVRESAEGTAAALADFMQDLRADPAAVRRTLEHYTSVIAATCSAAASKQAAEIKGNELAYDTVIVDEAARANPMDLFIPMAQAKRRIVLVGDHRQLPHILEPN